MTILNRLKLDLNNRNYFKDEEYTVFLSENDLTATDNYNKTTQQAQLIQSEIDILQALANDTDLMQKLDSADFGNVSACYKFIADRVQKLEAKLQDIKDTENKKYEQTPFTLMFTRN